MIRFIGAIMIFFAVSFFGIYLSDNIKRKKERLEIEEKMIEEIAVMIRWNSLTLNEIAEELFKNKIFTNVKFLNVLSEYCNDICSFPDAWEKAVLLDGNLSKEEQKILLEVGSTLGTTDKEGQLSALELYSTRIKKMQESEAEKYRQKGRMYRSLGVTAGAMIGIIII